MLMTALNLSALLDRLGLVGLLSALKITDVTALIRESITPIVARKIRAYAADSQSRTALTIHWVEAGGSERSFLLKTP